MARPTKTHKRDRQLNLKLTMRELCWVKERAAQAGMRPTEYGRARLLMNDSEQPATASWEASEDHRWLAQLSRLGNNLNQVARRLNDLRMPEPFELGPLLKDIREALAKGMRDGS